MLFLCLLFTAFLAATPVGPNTVSALQSQENNWEQGTPIQSTKDSLSAAQYYYDLAQEVSEASQYQALDHYQKAIAILPKSNSRLQSEILFQLGVTYTLIDDYPKALSSLYESLNINNTLSDSTSIRRDMSQIGYVHDRMYDYRESIAWNRKALAIAKKQQDTSAIAICLGRIGIAYDELAEKNNFNRRLFDSALYYNLQSAKLSELANDLEFARRTYSNLGNTYSKLKNYEKAEEFTLKSLAVKGSEKNKGVTLVNLGKIYLETGRYNEAQKILDSAMRNTVYYGTKKYQFEAYYRFHELAIKRGNYEDALGHYIAYKQLEDSLLNETKTKQIAEMSERFKSAEKEIQLANTRAVLAERELDVRQKNIQLIISVLSILLVLTLGYLIITQQRLKNRQLQRENELKDALAKIETQNKLQEQRLRISRDLHDNIGAQLTFIISSIDNLKYGFDINDEKLNTKLSGISSFTSDTIYELRDTIWAMNKNEIALEDLDARISNFIEKANISAAQTQFHFEIDKALGHIKFSSVEGMNLYRIIQEAVNNAIKYASASKIEVHISQDESDRIIFEIKDNGIGFEPSKISLGNGLNNMKKRAKEIGAQLEITTAPDQGTKIKLVK